MIALSRAAKSKSKGSKSKSKGSKSKSKGSSKSKVCLIIGGVSLVCACGFDCITLLRSLVRALNL